jgi:membrane associated rhomboid family serine protease
LAVTLIAVHLFAAPEQLGYVTGSGASAHLLTAGFAQVGWADLLGEVIFLLIFGTSAERHVPRWLFGAMVVVMLPVTIAAQAIISTDGVLVCGASGLVAACIGLSIIIQRRARVTVWLVGMVTMPLWVYGAGWALFQLVAWSMGLGGVTWVAHLAGFVAGLGIGVFAKKGSPA